MDIADFSPFAVAFIGILGVMLTNSFNGKREDRRRERDQEHQERLRVIDHRNAERSRLIEVKRVVYSELLRQVHMAPEAMEREAMEREAAAAMGSATSSFTVFNSDLWAAAAQAKLLVSTENYNALDEALTAFYRSHLRDVATTEARLVTVLGSELKAE